MTEQAKAVEALGGIAVKATGSIPAHALETLEGFSGVLWWGEGKTSNSIEQALANREGAIIPLIATMPDIGHVSIERHVCVDTTAAGGNAELLAGE